MKKAIYGGTFNPMHKGHISIVQKATKIFDLVYVVVAHNPEKEYCDIDERYNQVKEVLKFEKNVEVLKMEKGLLADLAKNLNVNFLVRSARDEKDFNFELMMAKQNKKLNSSLETILIMPDEINIEIRSSLMPK